MCSGISLGLVSRHGVTSVPSQLLSSGTGDALGSPRSQGWHLPVQQRGCALVPTEGMAGMGAPKERALRAQAWHEEHRGWHHGSAPPAPWLTNPQLSSGWRAGGEQCARGTGGSGPRQLCGEQSLRAVLRFTHRAGESRLMPSHFWDVLRRVPCVSGGMEPGDGSSSALVRRSRTGTRV